MDRSLTRDSDKLLCTLYKSYLERIKSGKSKSDSSYFEDSDSITNLFFPNDDPDDIASFCWELSTAGYLTCLSGDDIANEVILTNKGIIYMENRLKNKALNISDFIAKFF